jgi:hypothetical protein
VSRRRNPVGTSRRLQPGVEARDNECPPAVAFTLQRLSEKLLDSYSVERSEVGDDVLADAQRLTVIGAMRNPVGQAIRNTVGHLMLGLAPVRQAFADRMTEVVIGYSNSPLNGPALSGGPKPGARMVPSAGQTPVGSGAIPRFALRATPSLTTAGLFSRFPDVLDPELRPPIRQDAIWLVQPDGYVACAVAADGDNALARYLREAVLR